MERCVDSFSRWQNGEHRVNPGSLLSWSCILLRRKICRRVDIAETSDASCKSCFRLARPCTSRIQEDGWISLLIPLFPSHSSPRHHLLSPLLISFLHQRSSLRRLRGANLADTTSTLGDTSAETVLEESGNALESTHTAGSGGLSALGLLAPLDCFNIVLVLSCFSGRLIRALMR